MPLPSTWRPRVPAAPGWDVTELVRHIGQIHARTSVILRTGTMERPSRRNGMLADPPSDGVVDWYRSTLAELVTDLRGIDDPERPVYAFAPAHQRAGFWPRRMAQETIIHRVDAEQATGRPVRPIDPVLGADRSPGDGRTVHLHATDTATDTDGDWLIRFDDGAISVAAGTGDADAVVGGPAGELLQWLWGRRPLDGLELSGDRDAADALRTVTVF